MLTNDDLPSNRCSGRHPGELASIFAPADEQPRLRSAAQAGGAAELMSRYCGHDVAFIYMELFLSKLEVEPPENDVPGWMRVDELIRYSRAFYPAWDDVYAEELRQEFVLDPAAKIRNLSKGQKARAGLLIALAHRPELLVLDEPSSGLDPIVRRDILGAIIRSR